MGKSNFIAYLDVLGTKNISKISPEQFADLLISFHSQILNLLFQNEFNSIVGYHFSDSVFLEAERLDILIIFFNYLRLDLFNKGVFFKAAVSFGTLDAITDKNDYKKYQTEYRDKERYNQFKNIFSDEKVDLDLTKKNRPRFSGALFLSSDIANVYHLQDTFKGIGIRIDKKIVNQSSQELQDLINKFCVNSFFLNNIETSEIEDYTDIKFFSTKEWPKNPDYEVIGYKSSDQKIENLFNSFKEANIYKKSYGRYFLSAIATLIRSEDFSGAGLLY